MEDALGHVTHAQGLRAALTEEAGIDPDWMPIPYDGTAWFDRMAGLPFSIRLSLRARRVVRQRQGLAKPPDALFFHTQGLTPCCLPIIARTPSVISLDATPHNFLAIANAYGEAPARGGLGRVKSALFRAVFGHARGLVAFSAWVRDSLVNDYGADANKVVVIPPGIDTRLWQPPPARLAAAQRLRLLFVGGDFERKGGPLLMQAWQAGLSELCELDIVTRGTRLADGPGVRIHHDLTPNSPALKQLYAQADLFVLPSLGDASPFAVVEAMASGLPVVATQVGAVGEMVQHGVTGWLVAPGSAEALTQRIAGLAHDRSALPAFARAARLSAERRFHAPTNSRELFAYIRRVTAAHEAAPA